MKIFALRFVVRHMSLKIFKRENDVIILDGIRCRIQHMPHLVLFFWVLHENGNVHSIDYSE